MPTDPLFWAVAVLAVLLVALSKSGLAGSLGVVGVPLLALVMPARDAAGLMLPVLLMMDAVGLIAYRHEVDWRIFKIMIPGALVGTLIGWAAWSVISDALVLLIVGLITLAFIADAVLPLRRRLPSGRPSAPWGTFWGAMVGVTSFISHTGGPPFQVYVLPQRLAPAIYAGTAAWFFAVVNVAKLVPYFFLGQLSVANLSMSAVLMPVAIGGMLLGIYLVRRISAVLFYRLAYGLVFLLALKLIYDGIVDLAGWA